MIPQFFKENKLILQFSSFHLISAFAFTMFIPFMSLILLEKGLTTSQITYFFAIFTFSGFFFSPIIGKISDSIGKKNIMLAGLSFEMISMPSYFFINNIYILYFIRFFDAIAYSAVFFVMLSAFEDLIEEKRGFWTGLFLSIGTIGSLIGPIIAGFIADWNSNKILLLVSSGLMIFSFLFLLTIPENKKKENKKKFSKSDFNPLTEIKHFLKFRELIGMGILGILMNSKGQIYAIFFPILVIETLKLPYSYLGFLISIPIFFHIFQVYFGKIGDNISSEFGVILGVLLAASSIFFLPYINNLFELIILLSIYGIGSSIWNVNAWVLMGNIAKKYDIEGEIVGTYVSISKIGMFFTTLVSAYLVEKFGIGNTLQMFAIMVLIGVVIVYFFFKPIFHHESHKSIFHKVIKEYKS